MPRTPKKTPQKLAAIRAAREAGLGWRGAGAAAGVSAETARSWCGPAEALVAVEVEKVFAAEAEKNVGGRGKKAPANLPEVSAQREARTQAAAALNVSPRLVQSWPDVLAPVPGLETRIVDAIALRGLLLAVAELEAFIDELEAEERAGRLCASCPGRAGKVVAL